ncbi:hypothetical protein [Thomasclavelia sp.]
MGLFRSEDEVLQDEKKRQEKDLEEKKEENKRKRFYEELGIDSKEDIERLENIKNWSKRKSKELCKVTFSTGEFQTYYSVCASIVVDFNILNVLLDNKKALNSLADHNKDLNDKIDTLISHNQNLENKFDTLIKQNEDLNNKFDTLIEILKSK